MALDSALGARRYGQLDEEEEEGVARDSDVALRFAGGGAGGAVGADLLGDGVEANSQRVHDDGSHAGQLLGDVVPSILGQSQDVGAADGLRSAGQAAPLVAAPGAGPSKAHDDRDSELTRLRRENSQLRDEVERLKIVGKENLELQQVVKQLKQVVVSYGFSELEVMNAKPKAGKEGVEQLRYAPRDLFIIISMKFAEIAAYYGGAYIYTNYQTEEVGMTDQQAGNLYAAYGFISSFLGIFAGAVIDRLGVRKSLLIGTTCSLFGRTLTGLTTNFYLQYLISLTLFPLGGAFGVPVLALGVRRYSHKDNRKFAFSIFYTMLMLATLMGTMMINQIRGFFPVGMDIGGMHFTWMGVVWMMVGFFTSWTVLGAFFLRDIQVVDDRALEDMVVEPFKPSDASFADTLQVLKKIVQTPRFLRLTAVSLIFCGVQMGFRHLDATFPKYMMRTYGPNAPWEVILSVNPVICFFASPLCTALLIKWKVGFRKALIFGAVLSGFSPFIIAAFESYLGAIGWIAVMSLGQAIWGPKLYEYSTMSAPAGREGLFVAITAAPIYLSSVPTGIVSGWLLQHYCPANTGPEEKHGRALWFWVACSVATSPILLWILRKKLLKRGEDKPPEQAAQELGTRVGEDVGESGVPSAAEDMNLVDTSFGFGGNAGAAWAGMGMDPGLGGSLEEDSDEDFADEDGPRESRSTPSMRSHQDARA